MTRFGMFTDDELDAMEGAFCNEGLKYLVSEIRGERRYRELKNESKIGMHPNIPEEIYIDHDRDALLELYEKYFKGTYV